MAGCGPKAREDGRPAGRGKVSALQITTEPVEEVVWERKLQLVGTLNANAAAEVAAEVEGRIDKVLLEVGQTVVTADPLAQIDATSYQGMVNLQTANLRKAEANLDLQARNRQRLEQLKATGSTSANDYDDAVTAFRQSEAEVAAARSSLNAATTSLNRSTVKAPFSGVIVRRRVDVGDFARVGTLLFEVVDDSTLRFRGEVPESESSLLKAGMPLTITVDAFPERAFEGSVTWVNPAANVETRGVEIEAAVPNRGRELKTNFFARAELIVRDESRRVLTVPSDAVVSFAGVRKVFTVDGGKAVPVGLALPRSTGTAASSPANVLSTAAAPRSANVSTWPPSQPLAATPSLPITSKVSSPAVSPANPPSSLPCANSSSTSNPS
jgi:membrane fusion protein (multidrug efflux system)